MTILYICMYRIDGQLSNSLISKFGMRAYLTRDIAKHTKYSVAIGNDVVQNTMEA